MESKLNLNVLLSKEKLQKEFSKAESIINTYGYAIIVDDNEPKYIINKISSTNTVNSAKINYGQPTSSNLDVIDKPIELELITKSTKLNRLIIAKCNKIHNGFLLKKGSEINSEIASSLSDSTRKLRNSMIESHKVIDFIVMEDIFFKSASTAASFVSGYNCNGKLLWKTKSGLCLRDLIS